MTASIELIRGTDDQETLYIVLERWPRHAAYTHTELEIPDLDLDVSREYPIEEAKHSFHPRECGGKKNKKVGYAAPKV
jgi:hypothetical protein